MRLNTYKIIEMPLILSINTNINVYDSLLKHKNFINEIFLENINIYNNNYKLIGFITQPKPKHFISYFKNYYQEFSNSLDKWFKFDDMKGYYEELKNYELAINNIRDSESIVLFIYLKNN